MNAPPLDRGFVIRAVRHSDHDSVWRPVWGEYDRIRNHYNEMTVDLQEKAAPRRRLQVVFRVFDDGVGFRYVLPRQAALGDFAITSEETEFRFAKDFTTWWIPAQYGPGIGDEHLYRRTPLSEMNPANTPLTIEAADGGYVSLHEANLIDYASMTVVPLTDKSGRATPALRSALVPMPDGVKVRGSTPHNSPWRVLVMGDEPGDLIESTMVLNLNDPCAICAGDTSWIKPGKYVGVWWELHKGVRTWNTGPRHGATTENARRYIDFAARHGVEYVLTEGWNKGWGFDPSPRAHPQDFLTPTDDFDLEGVIAYAKSKGVEWIAHNETFGDVDNYLRQIDAAFAKYERLGVPGLKTGYADVTSLGGVLRPHYDQVMVNHYREVIRKAARHHLVIEAHEAIKDTGERRTYPNFLTRESVRGQEWEASEGNPPEHTVTLPFTRMVSGPMSYTPGIFNIKWDPAETRRRVHTTRAKQLAMYPVFLSGLQMMADVPENYEGNPELEFLEQVPATWDDTKVINAQIGDYITVARRSGRDWFVGSMSDEVQRTLSIPLRFLRPNTPYVAKIYGDAPGTDLDTNPDEVGISRLVVDNRDSLRAPMAGGGGQAVHLVPATSEDVEKLPRCGTGSPLCRPPANR